ncbi:MAG TPA: ADP-ribosyltransferase [Allosphingosinicella sp.]|jgi:hypothetical protein
MALSRDQAAAVRYYSGAGYRSINAELRGEARRSARIWQQVRLIDDAVARSATAEEIVVYRGVSGSYADALRTGGIMLGLVLSEPAFVSTSKDVDVAALFAEMPPGGFVLRIRLPAGSAALDIAPYSDYPGESELLLPRNLEFMVTGYDAARRVIELELA